ncbi:unnamed protein product [Choristocarpus tenellus]
MFDILLKNAIVTVWVCSRLLLLHSLPQPQTPRKRERLLVCPTSPNILCGLCLSRSSNPRFNYRLIFVQHTRIYLTTGGIPAMENGKRKEHGVPGWHTQQNFCRVVALAIVLLCLLCHGVIDMGIAVLWVWLRANPIFKHESFEPCLSTACFFLYIGFFGILDFFTPCVWPYRIGTSKEVVPQYINGKRVRYAIFGYLMPLVAFDLAFPRRVLPEEAPSARRLVLEVVGAIAVYDITFFLWHVTLHQHPKLYKKIHAKHHQKLVQRAPESVRHTFVDGTMDVMCSIFALNVLHCHPLSRALYDVVIIWLITELHAGYDFPWQVHNLLPFGLMGGPPRHDLHHRSGKVYMQKFGTYLDELFGFVPNKGLKLDNIKHQ